MGDRHGLQRKRARRGGPAGRDQPSLFDAALGPTSDHHTPDDSRDTVAFVGLDDYEVPVDALRRILGLVTDQARRNAGQEAS